MRTQTMRWLDDTVGSALCRLLAPFATTWPQRLAGGKTDKRVLFIGLAEMGGVVVADPAMRTARDIHGAAPYFVIFHQNRDSLALTGTVPSENTFCLRAGSLLTLAADTLRFMAWCRRKAISVAVDTDPCSNFSALLALISGAATRAGFHHAARRAHGRTAIFNSRVVYRADDHQARNLVALTEAALGVTPSLAPPAPLAISRQEIGPDEKSAVLARLQAVTTDFAPARHRIVLVNPNVGDLVPQRRWPRDNYAALIGEILDRHADVFVMLLGAAADAGEVARLAADVDDRRCRSVAGVFALTELPALFASSALLLTSDSGPAHFAAVTALPVVVLFGPETPVRYRPLGNATVLTAGIACSPCIRPETQRRTDCRDNRCMRAIGVATVIDAVERRLQKGPASLAYETPGTPSTIAASAA